VPDVGAGIGDGRVRRQWAPSRIPRRRSRPGQPRPPNSAGYSADASEVFATPTGHDMPVPPRPQ
jgi:hypothetical protein